MSGESIIEQNILAGSQFDGTNGGATGTITTVGGGSIGDGQSFFLKDGGNRETEFVFVQELTEQADYRREILYDGSETTAEIRDLIIRQVNLAPYLNLLASNGGAAQVDLLNRSPGTQGNVTPTTGDVGGGFAVSAMSGGVEAPISSSPMRGMVVYEPSTFGGVIDFDWLLPKVISGVPGGGVLTWRVDRIVYLLTTATTWTLAVVQSDGTAIELADETTEGGVEGVLSTPIVLFGDERLILTTTGATGPMKVRVYGSPERVLPS